MPTLFIGDQLLSGVTVNQVRPGIYLDNLSASSWIGNTYSFEATYPSSAYDIEISLDSSANPEQIIAFGDALICGSYNSNVITAKGTVPAIDIPAILKVVKK